MHALVKVFYVMYISGTHLSLSVLLFISRSARLISEIDRHISVCFSRTSAVQTQGRGVRPAREVEFTRTPSQLAVT